MTKNQNHDDDASSSSRRKRFKILDNGGVAPWSDLNNDVLFLVMMQLGFVDFFAFSGVCKSWRSLALSNRNMFMATKPPMSVCSSIEANDTNCYYLEDFKRRKFKPIIPHYSSRLCVGSTCGYLVLLCFETREVWLVNPITRHELHFPEYPLYVCFGLYRIRVILFFSPSTSGWVLLMLYNKILLYTVGKQRWNHIASGLPIIDLHVFKGKIYTLHNDCSLRELRPDLNRKCQWTSHETNIFLKPDLLKPELISSDEKLYLIDPISQKVLELDFGEMKWVSPEDTIGDYVFFISMLNPSAAIKPESWVGLQTQYKSYDYVLDTDKSRKRMFNYRRVWYFLHDFSNVNLLNE